MLVDGERCTLQARMHLCELGLVFYLHTEVIEPRLRASLGNREIDTWIVEHPFRVVGFFDGGLAREQRRVKADAGREIVDRQMDM
ncbi:hypothetical protein UE98_30005 [Burkholderia cenocepacia]|nr:hypothetical protein UE98_30005 [Burkholderia cenocepacia]